MRQVFRYSLAGVLALAAVRAAVAQDKMPWQPNLETAQRVAGQTNRLVLIHFWAPWCRPCVRLEREVFSNSETARGLEANFVMVKLNADEAPGTARLYGVSSLPSDVITTATGQMVSQIHSPPTSAQYVAQMNQAAAGHRSLARKNSATSTQQSGPGAAVPVTPPVGSGASYEPSNAQPRAIASPPSHNSTGFQQQAYDPQSPLPHATGHDRYAEYFPEQQAKTRYGEVRPTQAYGPAAAAAVTAANPNPSDPYAVRPGMQAPPVDPYAAAPSTAQAPPVDPYAAPGGPPPTTNPYVAGPPAGQAPPPVDPYASGPQAAPPAGSNSYAAGPPAGQAPPPVDPYADAPPAGSNPYVVGPPVSQSPRPVNPYAAPPAAGPTTANPYVSAPVPQNVPQLPPGSPPIGLDGNCPVTLVERKRWTMGHPAYGVVHRGRTYLFLGPQEKEKFLADPDRYSPVLSGVDPVLALDNQVTMPGRREFGVFGADGRIYLFADENSRARFESNEQHYATRALQATQTQYQAMRPGQQ